MANLSYDDAAFAYFGISFLVLFLVPSSIYLLVKLWGARKPSVEIPKAVTAAQQKQFEELQAKQTFSKRLMTPCWTTCLVMWVVAALLLWLLLSLIAHEGEIAVYDPFTILGVESGSSDRVIKKAFRKLSLLYHPDKNPGDSVAAEMFMKVAKAYEALTDEVARENFEKFGNPDGKQSLEVSIGLPSWLLDADNKMLVIMVYLGVLVICVPAVVYWWYNSNKDYGEKNIMNVSYGWFYHKLTEGINIKNFPELLVETPDFRNMPMQATGSGLQEEAAQLFRTLRSRSVIQKPSITPNLDKGAPKLYGLFVGLHAYLTNTPMSDRLAADVEAVLRKSDDLIDAMMEIALTKNSKRNYLHTVMAIIEFNQRLTQGLWVKESNLLQIPHFTDVEVGHCRRGQKKVGSLGEYITAAESLTSDNLKGLRDFTPQQIEEVMDFLRIVPNLDIQVDLEVVDEEGICENDVVTCRVTLTHKNLGEDEPVPPVHSPRFPYVKRERWALLLINDKDALIGYLPVKNTERVHTESIKFMSPPQKAGGHKFKLHVLSRDYVGLDQVVPISFVPGPARPEIETHEEDKQLGTESSLFDMAGDHEDSSDYSDSDDEDEKENDDDDAALDEALGSAAEGLTRSEKLRRLRRLQAKKGKSEGEGTEEAKGEGGDEDLD